MKASKSHVLKTPVITRRTQQHSLLQLWSPTVGEFCQYGCEIVLKLHHNGLKATDQLKSNMQIYPRRFGQDRHCCVSYMIYDVTIGYCSHLLCEQTKAVELCVLSFNIVSSCRFLSSTAGAFIFLSSLCVFQEPCSPASSSPACGRT